MLRTIALALVAATLTASLAEAQNVSFDRLALRLNQGDRVTVTDSDGQALQGRIVDLSSSTLALEADGLRRDLDRGDIAVIRRQERDSLKNGALIGGLAGFAAGGLPLLILAAGPSESDVDFSPWVLMSASVFTAAGAGIGAGVDALIKDSRVIYRASPSRQRFTVSPVVSPERQGLSVSFGF